ncbi:MAG: hypothetical protein ACP5O5_05005 [Fervidicoccaceae archaeon]
MTEVPIPKEVLAEILEKIKGYFKSYNKSISGSGYYLKPIHFSSRQVEGKKRKYVYLGRYWWKVLYLGRTKEGKVKLKWIYVGKTKPSGLPEPPDNPLEGVSIYIKEGEDDFYFIDLKGEKIELIEKIEKILGKKIRE